MTGKDNMTTTKREPAGTIWVCYDCTHVHVNGEEPIDRPQDQPETWALWLDDDTEITAGLLREQHECDDPEAAEAGTCGCERIDFSKTPCEGCGSRDAGARHAFTTWTPAGKDNA